MKIKMVLIIVLFSIMYVNAQDNQGSIVVEVLFTNCSLHFEPGWNLFSFCNELQEKDLTKVFEEIEGKYRYIMHWDKSRQQFDIYSPRSEKNPFQLLDDNESYFVYMNQEIDINIDGIEAGPEKRQLVEGWATPSYPYQESRLIDDIITDIKDKFRYLMKYDAKNQQFQIYSKLSNQNPFTTLNMGDGQFTYAYDDTTLTYI